MATHTRYPEIKQWAETTGRRSIQLWMPQDTVQALERLCHAQGLRRAELLDSLINEASSLHVEGRDVEKAQSQPT